MASRLSDLALSTFFSRRFYFPQMYADLFPADFRRFLFPADSRRFNSFLGVLISHYSSLTTHLSLLISHFSLLTTHLSLLISHYSSQPAKHSTTKSESTIVIGTSSQQESRRRTSQLLQLKTQTESQISYNE